MLKIFSSLIAVCCIAVLFSCNKEYSVDINQFVQARGSLWDSTGNCLPDSVYGTFYNGVFAGPDTAFVEVQVNVTQAGSYNITSDLQNGFLFADSGIFSNTGLNIIHLKAVGAAILPAPTTFLISFDSTVCSFTVDVQDSTGTGLGGEDTTGTGGGDTSQVQADQWKFTSNSFIYKGSIDSAAKDNSSGVATLIHLNGATETGDTTLNLEFLIAAADIQPGTYTATDNAILFSVVDGANFSPLFSANAIILGASMTIEVISYDAVTKQMKATFSANAQSNTGSIVPVTDGSLDVIFR